MSDLKKECGCNQCRGKEAMSGIHIFVPKNEYLLSSDETLERAGIDIEEDADMLMDSIVPACCSEGCEVEPDGVCEHGCPSVLLAMGMI